MFEIPFSDLQRSIYKTFTPVIYKGKSATVIFIIRYTLVNYTCKNFIKLTPGFAYYFF